MKSFLLFATLCASLAAQEHRAEQDREITYWLLPPDTHQFQISHDFNVTRTGQKSVHSFVRKGSAVTKARMIDLDTGEELKTYNVSGESVNALGYYPTPTASDSVVVQGDLSHPLGKGESVRVRVIETYTDPKSYFMANGELTWDRTLGRPRNIVVLPEGYMLTGVNVPAIIALDANGRITCRFTNPRNDEIHVIIKARQRKGS